MKKLFLITLTALIFLSWSLVVAHELTDEEQMEISMQQMFYIEAVAMDRANACYRATGSYSVIKCNIRERNFNLYR